MQGRAGAKQAFKQAVMRGVDMVAAHCSERWLGSACWEGRLLLFCKQECSRAIEGVCLAPDFVA